MRIHFVTAFVACAFAGCGSSDGGGTPPALDAEAGGGDSGGSPGVVTYETVKAMLFSKKCVPCHLPGGIGMDSHTLADSYASVDKPSVMCAPKKIGACTIVVVKSGYMPFGKGCSGDPAKDSGKDACLTAAEQKLLEDWIAGGLKEK